MKIGAGACFLLLCCGCVTANNGTWTEVAVATTGVAQYFRPDACVSLHNQGQTTPGVPDVTAILRRGSGLAAYAVNTTSSSLLWQASNVVDRSLIHAAVMARHIGALDTGVGTHTHPGEVDVVTTALSSSSSLSAFATTQIPPGKPSNQSIASVDSEIIVLDMMLSDDGTRLICWGFGHGPVLLLSVYDTNSLTLLWQHEVEGDIPGGDFPAGRPSLAASREGRFIALSMYNDTQSVVLVYDSVAKALRAPVVMLPYGTPVSICPMGVFLLYGGAGGTGLVNMWDPKTNTFALLHTIKPPSSSSSSLSLPAFPTDWVFSASTPSVNGEDKYSHGCYAGMAWTSPSTNTTAVMAVSMITGAPFMTHVMHGAATSDMTSHLGYFTLTFVPGSGPLGVALFSVYYDTGPVFAHPKGREAKVVVLPAVEPLSSDTAASSATDSVFLAFAEDNPGYARVFGGSVLSLQPPTSTSTSTSTSQD